MTEGNDHPGATETGSAGTSAGSSDLVAARPHGTTETARRAGDESDEVARLANDLDASRQKIRDLEEKIAELETQVLDLSVDLAANRQELGRILQSRSFRFAQKMQAAYARSSILRRIANAPVATRLLGAQPAGFVRATAEVNSLARQKIQASGLFDEAFYRQRYAAHIKIPDDLLADFISCDHGDVRDPGPLFSTRHYLKTYVDVAASGLNPLEHFVLHGAREGRVAFSPEKVRNFLSRVDTRAVNSVFDIVPHGSNVTVLYAENGNFFFQDIAIYVAELLTEQGCRASAFTDLPTGVDPSTDVVVVVAPHEFFFIGPGKGWASERVAQVAHVNTEQWQTPWFAKCFQLLMGSLRGVLDINPNSAAGMVKLGAKAAFLPIVPIKGSVFEQKRTPITPTFAKLKYIRPLDYPDDVVDRTYDIAYVAVSNPRRGKALAELAGHIAPYRCFIHNPRFDRPITRDDLDMIGGSDLSQIARNTKILLNIHRDHVGYLEWHRIFVYGVMNGCVVVTEPCFANDFITDGRNYLSASLAEIPVLLKELLETDVGRKRLRDISRNNIMLSRTLDSGNRFLR